jgi:hypothetical protein
MHTNALIHTFGGRSFTVPDRFSIGKQPVLLENSRKPGKGGAVTGQLLYSCHFVHPVNEVAYFASSSFGSTSATSPNFVFPFSVLSTPTILNCSGIPARSS